MDEFSSYKQAKGYQKQDLINKIEDLYKELAVERKKRLDVERRYKHDLIIVAALCIVGGFLVAFFLL